MRPEGRNRRGETRLRGPEVLGPLRGLSFQYRAPERLAEPRGRLFRGLGEVCPFSKERGKKVGHSEASKRPRFPGCPLKGFQPSGSYPQVREGPLGRDDATDLLLAVSREAGVHHSLSRRLPTLAALFCEFAFLVCS